jgi:hypothetical protein
VEALYDQEEDLQDKVDSARKAIIKAKKRNQPTGDKERELAECLVALHRQLRSAAHRRCMEQVRAVMLLLPELVLRLPALDPYYGTEAQGVPHRDFACYSGPCFVCSVGRPSLPLNVFVHHCSHMAHTHTHTHTHRRGALVC